MKLAVSNIAWAAPESGLAYALLKDSGVSGLEIAPALAFPDESDPFAPSVESVNAFRDVITLHGLELVSMQSLLFGTNGAQLFGTAVERRRLEDAVERALVLANRLGIPNVVFGSPRNRVYPHYMSENEAVELAGEIFVRIGLRADELGCVIAIEPNSRAYGTNFLTSVRSALHFVERLALPAIRLNFDIGTLLAENEASEIENLKESILAHTSHVHISEPQLAPAPAWPRQLASIAQPFLLGDYSGWFSIEMRRADENPLEVLRECISRAREGLATRARE